MSKLHEDYYLRKCFLENNQVPTQSDIKKKMGPALANVYFKSMTPQHGRLAGLHPPLKGGGKDWYIPPKELLKGKAVMKPIQKTLLSKLSCDGILFYGSKVFDDNFRRLEIKKQKLLQENELNWQNRIKTACEGHAQIIAAEEETRNSSEIENEFQEFSRIYRTSITKVESLLKDAGLKELQRVKNRAINEIYRNFNVLKKQQSKLLQGRHEENFKTEKNKCKKIFMQTLEYMREDLDTQVNEIKMKKHFVVERQRLLLESQNLACQVYVALKERIECDKELNISKYKHDKTIKKLTDKITMKDFEIKLAREKEKEQSEFNRIWQRKVCLIVKKFQEFVKYCLKVMPDYADFFINMEKLMLLQLGDTLENPSAESLYQNEPYYYPDQTPVPPIHPFYLVYDESLKSQIDTNLCPKHCTCGASQLPVIVVNKRCMYAACDNFDLFLDKVQQFVDGKRGNEEDFIDDHDYTYDVPIDCTSSDELKQLQLESSLMQILQTAFPNIKQVSSDCSALCTRFCVCFTEEETKTDTQIEVDDEALPRNMPSGNKITLRTDELKHLREPKIDSYLDFILPQICRCSKMAKKHLKAHLPAYMRNMSAFETVDLPNYETCNLGAFKRLVFNSRKVKPEEIQPLPKMAIRDASTQYSDEENDILCDCFSNEELEKLSRYFDVKLQDEKVMPFTVFEGSFPSSHVENKVSNFAFEAALELKQVIRESPELKELFTKEDCSPDNFLPLH